MPPPARTPRNGRTWQERLFQVAAVTLLEGNERDGRVMRADIENDSGAWRKWFEFQDGRWRCSRWLQFAALTIEDRRPDRSAFRRAGRCALLVEPGWRIRTVATIAAWHGIMVRRPLLLRMRHGLAGRDRKSEQADRENRRHQARSPVLSISAVGKHSHEDPAERSAFRQYSGTRRGSINRCASIRGSSRDS